MHFMSLVLKIMEQPSFFRDVSLIFLILAPILFLIFKNVLSLSSKKLPPGPRPWPIIGNILQIGKEAHISFTKFAQLYGPLISLKLGTQLVVVASSPAAAAAILKTHDRLLCGRSVPEIVPFEGFEVGRLSLIWDECTDKWKFLRNLCKTELFSSKAMESSAAIREKKVDEMMEFLGTKEGKVVNIADVVSTTVLNSVSNLFFSKDLCYLRDGESNKLNAAFLKGKEMATIPNIADFYPVFSRFDLQGLKKKVLDLHKELDAVWEDVLRERRESSEAKENLDFLDVLIANGLDDDQINYLVIELLSASGDTTSSTVEWTMAELVKNKEALTKVHEELEREIEQDSIKESDLSRLPYLLACIMETLRLHPPVPFLLPHRALETCQVMNYTIPENTRVLVNLWAIGRDPVTWEDPLSFKPERFLHSKMNFQGHDFGFLPFGSGRRICPGQPMASKQLLLLLAHLLHGFDWCLPNDEDPAQLDMDGELGLALHKAKPLCLIPIRKLQCGD